ncbi:MAG: lysophospholipid acyltransferase family protein [Kordiimonadaceae bacterium]|nr:lysophospholipid acyltransferase family protein [Kordiimonadaceae bacterium]
MQKKQIYDNALFATMMSGAAKLFLKMWGWKLAPGCTNLKKVVVIAAPHTSNWDFLFFLAVTSINRLPLNFMAKHTLFKGFFGRIFYYLGGVPVHRSKEGAADMVDQMVLAFAERDIMQLCITPEGTRSKVKKWKTGFYRIALAAGVPIVLGFVDAKTKTTGFGPVFHPTGDMDADIAEIKKFYAEKVGVNANND